MAGLVGYASSDEDSEAEQQASSPVEFRRPLLAARETAADHHPQHDTQAQQLGISEEALNSRNQPQAPQDASLPTPPQAGPLQPGPVGPLLPPMTTNAPQLHSEHINSGGDDAAAPSSPYLTARSLIQDLTLPSIPNFDIPPSPPPQSRQTPSSSSTSSSSGAAATGKKFEQFLQLKKKGTHFNAKLEQSTALRNPALTDKLLAFVDVGGAVGGSAGTPADTRGAAEYATTLPAEVWDPRAFPDWAFRSRLRRTRDVVAKEREAARSGPNRTAIEFVAASDSITGPAGPGARGEKRRGDWK